MKNDFMITLEERERMIAILERRPDILKHKGKRMFVGSKRKDDMDGYNGAK
jgi:hypothetical protein